MSNTVRLEHLFLVIWQDAILGTGGLFSRCSCYGDNTTLITDTTVTVTVRCFDDQGQVLILSALSE